MDRIQRYHQHLGSGGPCCASESAGIIVRNLNPEVAISPAPSGIRLYAVRASEDAVAGMNLEYDVCSTEEG
jgi:hypothetical protein